MSGRRRIAAEVLETEKKYLESLKVVQEIFMKPLRGSKIISENDFNILFGQIPTIINVNRELYSELEKFEEEDRNGKKITKEIGRIFVDLGPWLKVYTAYCNAYDSMADHLRFLKKKNSKFTKFLEKVNQDPASNGLGLGSYLIMPVQRIPRYQLLLRELIKTTSKYHKDYNDLCEAEAMIRDVAAYINEKVKDSEERTVISEIASKISNLSYDLVQPSRQFRFQGELRKISERAIQTRVFFVFNDVILYCKRTGKGSYKYRGRIELKTSPLTWIRDLPDSAKVQNAFQIVGSQKTYSVIAESPKDKLSWMTKLTNTINDLVDLYPELKESKAPIRTVQMNKFFKFFTLPPDQYDPTVSPQLPPRTNLPDVNVNPRIPLRQISSVNFGSDSSLVVVYALYRFENPNEETDLGFEVGDILFVFEETEDAAQRYTKDKEGWHGWTLAKHSGFRFFSASEDGNLADSSSQSLSMFELIQVPTAEHERVGIIPRNYINIVLDRTTLEKLQSKVLEKRQSESFQNRKSKSSKKVRNSPNSSSGEQSSSNNIPEFVSRARKFAEKRTEPSINNNDNNNNDTENNKNKENKSLMTETTTTTTTTTTSSSSGELTPKRKPPPPPVPSKPRPKRKLE